MVVLLLACAAVGLAATVLVRRVERARAHEHELLQAAILDAAPDAVVAIDRRGRILEFNAAAAALFGRSRAEVLGADGIELLPAPALREASRRILGRVVDGRPGEPARFAFAALRSDGVEVPVDVALTRTDAGDQAVVTAFVHDISELKRAHDELERAVAERTAELRSALADVSRREERLRQAEALASVGSFEWDLADDRLTCSEQLLRILGTSGRSPMTLSSFLDHVHPEDRARVRARLYDALEARASLKFDHRIIRADDGSERVLDCVVAIPRDDAVGHAVRLVCTCHDVTERRKTEASQAMLAAVVEASGDAVIAESPDGIIRSWNQGAEQIYGYSREEAVGRATSILHPPDRVLEVLESISGVRRGETVSFETLGRTRDRGVFDVAVKMSPIHDHAGRVVAISATMRDVTETKRAEARLRDFVDAVPVATMHADREGRILIANSATERLFGRPTSELAGTALENLVALRFREPLAALLAKRLRDPQTSTPGGGWVEMVAVRSGGAELPVELEIARTGDGRSLVVAIRDITTRLAMEAKVLDSLKEKEVLLREIHHRVKNNLQVIASLLRLQASGASEADVHKIFEESQGRIQSIALVHQLLYQSNDLANLDLTQYVMRLLRRLVDSYGAADRIVLSVHAAGALNLDIDTAVPCGLILNELVANAIKHAFPEERHGRIDVSLGAEAPASLVVTVADDGVGFPDRFVRLSEVRTLGLQVVQSLAKQLRGTIAMSSSARGSELVLRFPAPAPAPAAAA